MFNHHALRVIISAFGGVACTAVAAAQVVNGGFEQPGLGFRTVAVGETYGGWTNAGPGNIEFVHAVFNPSLPNLQFSAYEGDYWIDLVGTGSPSGIYQDITGLLPGETYRIDWAQAGNVWGSNFAFTMRVLWNGVQVAEFTQTHGGNNGQFMNWQLHSVEVTASLTSGINRLQFQAVTGISARGPALDAVSITLVPGPGGAVALAGAGLLGLRRRRR
jgi:uncharacterized protein (TIGR03382 family)